MRKTVDEQIPVDSDEGDCMRPDVDTAAVTHVDDARNHVINCQKFLTCTLLCA